MTKDSVKNSVVTNDFGVPKKAIERLALEESWLESSRVHFRASDSDYLQLCFAQNINASDAIDVIRQFYLCVKKGITPPAKVLIAVAERFEKYIANDGNESLDVFFGKVKKKGKKEPLRQQLQNEIKGKIYYFMWYQMKIAKENKKTLTILAAAAAAVHAFQLSKSRDSLEKEYIASKVGTIFDMENKIRDELSPKLRERITAAGEAT